LRILCGIELLTEKSEIGAGGGAQVERIFSDARGKNQGIYAVGRRNRRADAGLQAMHKDFKSYLQPRWPSFIAATICRMSLEIPEIPGKPDLVFSKSSSCSPVNQPFHIK
jgi:hypothetical protein